MLHCEVESIMKPAGKKRDMAAAATKKAILKAAGSLFAQKGFAGASISEIAKKAGINQSLIYHYFPSKEELWKSVKTNFVEMHIRKEGLAFETGKGLKALLEQIVLTRYKFFQAHPEILRMLGWQRLEPKKELLMLGTAFSPDNWRAALLQLQKQGEIRSDIDADFMALYINSLIMGIFNEDFQKKLSDSTALASYLNLIIDSLLRIFGGR